MKRAAVLALLVALDGCTVRQSTMPYSPTISIVPDSTHRDTIRVDRAIDERNEDASWFGTIRGGYGNPIKVLRADEPIAQVVRRAFDDGLRVRGLYAEPSTVPGFTLWITVHQFEASQLVRRDANTDLALR